MRRATVAYNGNVISRGQTTNITMRDHYAPVTLTIINNGDSSLSVFRCAVVIDIWKVLKDYHTNDYKLRFKKLKHVIRLTLVFLRFVCFIIICAETKLPSTLCCQIIFNY